MRYLALDLGIKNCGVAISDKTNILSSPLKTIRYQREDYETLSKEINQIILDNNITHLIIGKPVNMDGSYGFATRRGEEFLKFIKQDNIDVIFIDERLTTVMAQNIFHTNGKDIRKSKKDIDTLSACLILESYIKKVNNENR